MSTRSLLFQPVITLIFDELEKILSPEVSLNAVFLLSGCRGFVLIAVQAWLRVARNGESSSTVKENKQKRSKENKKVQISVNSALDFKPRT